MKKRNICLSNKVILHVGYPKSGSTWLQDNLFSNKNNCFQSIFPNKQARREFIELLMKKDIFSFDKNEIQDYVNDKFYDLFKKSDIKTIVISCEDFVGPIHDQGKSIQKDTLDRLKLIFPNAKILLILREQISCLLSQYYQQIRGGSTISLERGLQRKNVLDHPGEKIICKEFYEYDKTVEYLIKLFSKKNIKVYLFEDMFKNMSRFIRHLNSFCKTSINKSNYSLKNFKKGIPSSSVPVRRIMSFFISKDNANPMRYIFPQFLYWRVYVKLMRRVDSLLRPFDKAYKSRHIKVVLKLTGNSFAESNKRLKKIYKLNLKKFGYKL